MSKLNKDTVIEQFISNYTAVNGQAPKVEAKGGWYKVNDAKGIRLADLQANSEALEAQLSKSTAETVKTEPLVSEKPAEVATEQDTPEATETVVEQGVTESVENTVAPQVVDSSAAGTDKKSSFSIKAIWKQIVKKVAG